MWTNRVFVCSALAATSFHFTPQLSQKAMLEKFFLKIENGLLVSDNFDFDFFYFDPYHHNHQQKQHDRV